MAADGHGDKGRHAGQRGGRGFAEGSHDGASWGVGDVGDADQAADAGKNGLAGLLLRGLSVRLFFMGRVVGVERAFPLEASVAVRVGALVGLFPGVHSCVGPQVRLLIESPVASIIWAVEDSGLASPSCHSALSYPKFVPLWW